MATVGAVGSKKPVKAQAQAAASKAKAAAKAQGIKDAFDVHSVRAAGIEAVTTVKSKSVPGIAEQFPLADLSKIDGRGKIGEVFFLDGGSLRDMKLTARRVVDNQGTPGFELSFRLMHKEQERLESLLNKKSADKSPIQFSATELQGGVVRYTAKRGEISESGSYSDSQTDSYSEAWMLSAPGSKGGQLEFARPSSAHALRGLVRLNIRGDDAQCQKQLDGLLKDFGLQQVFAPPSSTTTERFKLMRLLWQRSHKTAEQLARSGKLDQLKTSELQSKLAAAGVSKAEIDSLRFSDVAPSHFTVINPSQVDRMVEAGARYLYSTCSSAEHIAAILKHGQKSSLRRYQDGLIFDGMSTQDDFSSGGGAGVFTRMVTQESILQGESWNGRTYRIVLKADILARTDWFGHWGDEFGRAHKLDKDNFGANLVERIQDDGSYRDDNELIFRDAIGPQYIAHVTAPNDSARNELLKVLKREGFKPYDGSSLEEFVVLAPKFIQYGPQPEIKDLKKFIADAKKQAAGGNESKLKWFLAFGPPGPERAKLEEELLLGADDSLREAFFDAVHLGKSFAIDKARMEAIVTELASKKSNDDGHYLPEPNSLTLQRMIAQCPVALLRLDSDELAPMLEKNLKVSSLGDGEWVEVLQSLADMQHGAVRSPSYELALGLATDRLLSKEHSGFWSFCESHPLVKPDGASWFSARLSKLSDKNAYRDLSLFVAQSKKLGDVAELQLTLIKEGSPKAVTLLASTLSKFGDLGADGPALAQAIGKLGPSSKMKAYLAKSQAELALIRTGEPAVLDLVDKRWSKKPTNLGRDAWTSLITELSARKKPAAVEWALRHAGASLMPVDSPGPGSLYQRLGSAKSLFELGSTKTFIDQAIKDASSTTKANKSAGALRLAWLFAKGPAKTRSELFEAVLRSGVKGKEGVLEWMLRHCPGRELPVSKDALVQLALDFDNKAEAPQMKWLLQHAGRALLLSGKKAIAPLVVARKPADFGVSAPDSLALLGQLFEAKSPANEAIADWLSEKMSAYWLRDRRDATIATFRELELYPEDLGLPDVKSVAGAVRDSVDELLDAMESGYYYDDDSGDERPFPEGMPKKAEWLLARGGTAPDPEIVEAVLAALPEWQNHGSDSWTPFVDRLEKHLPKSWKSKIAKVRKKLEEW